MKRGKANQLKEQEGRGTAIALNPEEDKKRAEEETASHDGHARRDRPRYPPHPRHAAAPLSVRDDRPRGGVHRQRRTRRDQEREYQRTVFSGPLPRQSRDARRAHARSHGSSRCLAGL